MAPFTRIVSKQPKEINLFLEHQDEKYKRRSGFDNMNTENIIKTLWAHRRKLFTNKIYDKSDSGQMQKIVFASLCF